MLDPSPSTQGLDAGSIGETNVYLTIFIDGICCVRFAWYQFMTGNSLSFKSFTLPTFRVCRNVVCISIPTDHSSEHTDRIQNHLLSGNNANMSSGLFSTMIVKKNA